MSNYTGNPSTFPGGSKITAAKLADWEALLDALSDGWTSYAVQWTGATTNPTIGNGTLLAEYKQIGKLVHYRGFMLAGSTTVFPTGAWHIDYPVTPDSRGSSFAGVIGNLFIQDTSAGANYLSQLVSLSTTQLVLFAGGSTPPATNTVSNLVPMTWAAGDRFSWSMFYVSV